MRALLTWPVLGVPLDLDGNLVRAGVLPLLLVVLLGVVIALLYVWMRHEIKKIQVPSVADAAPEQASEPADPRG